MGAKVVCRPMVVEWRSPWLLIAIGAFSPARPPHLAAKKFETFRKRGGPANFGR